MPSKMKIEVHHNIKKKKKKIILHDGVLNQGSVLFFFF